MSPFPLALFAYLGVALPSSTLGILWPSMRGSLHAPLAALGILLAFGTVASVVSSTVTGRVLGRVGVGALLPAGAVTVALALGLESIAPALWIVVVGATLFSLGFGAIDTALNAHAAHHFGARQVNWMHASYGLGATMGPLVVTAMLGAGFGWRRIFGAFALVIVALGVLFAVLRGAWAGPPVPSAADIPAPENALPRPQEPQASRRPPWAALGALVFTAVETGIESGAGIWGYVFLTAGRGLQPTAAGLTVSAYWAMMVVGRAVLGPIAERVGVRHVLAVAVAGVALGAGIMALPGPSTLGVAGMMALGLAAAPIFPLLTLTARDRSGEAGPFDTTQMVSLQVAASAVGSAALPSALGVAIAALGAGVFAPLLLVLGLAMGGLYVTMVRVPRVASS